MSTLQEIEQAIERLSEQEKSELRAWLDSVASAEVAKKRQEAISRRITKEAERLAEAVKFIELSANQDQSLSEDTFPPSKVRPAKYLDRDQWIAAFNRWVESNRDVTAVADDSRESIYAGRGE